MQITQVPAADPGGPAKMDFIEGRVSNAGPGQQIVLYAHSGIWWVQPFVNQEFTKIQPDSTFRNLIHLGAEYAAVLVEPNYHPASKMTALPPLGNGVVAVAMAKGKPAGLLINKTIHFSGYDWQVQTSGSDRGGQPNAYDPDNVWTDDKGYLHLRMQLKNGIWTCAELYLTRSLGYGSYSFVVQDSAHLSQTGVLGLYTVDDLRTDDIRSELDVELSRWGSPTRKNAQYVVQPFYIPENVSRFDAPPGVLTHTFRWEPGRATFKSFRGTATGNKAAQVNEHVFVSGVPTPAKESVHIDLYDYHHSMSAPQQPTEVVIEKFEFLP